MVFWIFLLDCILLGWIGGEVIETPFYKIGQLLTFYYFFFFIVIIPFIIKIEKIWLKYEFKYNKEK